MHSGIASIHECHICSAQVLGRTRTLPHGWMRFITNERNEICPDCQARWKERFNEDAHAYNDEELMLI